MQWISLLHASKRFQAGTVGEPKQWQQSISFGIYFIILCGILVLRLENRTTDLF